jgi:hypothetical protein
MKIKNRKENVYMNRYYARVKTEVGIVTFTIKYKTVNSIDAAEKRLITHFKFQPENILSVSDKRINHNNTYHNSDKVNQLLVLVQQLIHNRNEVVNIGQI